MSAATEAAARLLREAEDAHRKTYGGVSPQLWCDLAVAWTDLAGVEAVEERKGSSNDRIRDRHAEL